MKAMEVNVVENPPIEAITSLLPKRVFDFHVHLYLKILKNREQPSNVVPFTKAVTCCDFESSMGGVFTGGTFRANLLSWVPPYGSAAVTPAWYKMENSFICSELEKNPGYVGEVFVLPETGYEEIEAWKCQ